MIDIIINFNSAYLDDYDHLVINRLDIACNYFKSWFIIDFLSSIPINEFMFFVMGPNSGNKNLGLLAKVLRLLKYWRLIKILRMSKVITMLKKSEWYKNIIIFYGESF